MGVQKRTRREFSAGAVLVRRMRGDRWVAVTRPQGKPVGTWTLPKGLVEPGEPPEEAALRETAEETGLTGRIAVKLGDVRYVYTWDGARVLKIVSFYLAHARAGRIGELPAGMEIEVAEVRWLRLGDAGSLLAYPGEREMARRARALLDAASGATGRAGGDDL
jgi:8-oxo-dGTP pyrophosphatase MutT (NUDIX family)